MERSGLQAGCCKVQELVGPEADGLWLDEELFVHNSALYHLEKINLVLYSVIFVKITHSVYALD